MAKTNRIRFKVKPVPGGFIGKIGRVTGFGVTKPLLLIDLKKGIKAIRKYHAKS